MLLEPGTATVQARMRDRWSKGKSTYDRCRSSKHEVMPRLNELGAGDVAGVVAGGLDAGVAVGVVNRVAVGLVACLGLDFFPIFGMYTRGSFLASDTAK
jgi:hypothetical protein